MTEVADNWLHFSARQRKRKRAELVCVFCHSKKIKCDLQSRNSQGHEKCSNCDNPDRECRVRPSKRGKQRHSSYPSNNSRDERAVSSPPGQDVIVATPDVGVLDLAHTSISQPHPSPPSHQEISIPTVHSAPAQSQAQCHPQPQPQVRPQHPPLSTGPPSNQNPASTSPGEGAGRSHAGDVDTGFLQVYAPENQSIAEQQEFEAILESKRRFSHPRQQELLQSFAETYWEYIYPWCPVLDSDILADDLARSPMLANALALAASNVQPPLIPHEGSATYYDHARNIFYNDEEPDGLTMLKALCLFYWWSPRPPATAHRHASWWWTSVVIRNAQQMDIHRELSDAHPLASRLNKSLRRRIWWTVFARERLTALCQSKPCIIDPEDCNIQPPQPTDFPDDPASQRKGQIFIHWVRLCAIIGRIAKRLSRTFSAESNPFPLDLQQELVDWVQSLPPELQLPIGSARTESFDRDVHQLHLPYLTTIIILHLKRSSYDLPQALPPAILAASCIARIMRDILQRGSVRFLMAITCWYSGTAFLALLQACRVEQFAQEAEENLEVLTHAVTQMQSMWGSAKLIRQGFDRLRKSASAHAQGNSNSIKAGYTEPPPPTAPEAGPFLFQSNAVEVLDPVGSLDWTQLFPFVTRSTSRIAECLLDDREQGTATEGFPFAEDVVFHETMLHQYQDLLDMSGGYHFDFTDMGFQE